MLPDTRCSQLIDALIGTDKESQSEAIRELEDKSKLDCLRLALDSESTPDYVKETLCEILYRARWPEAAPILIRQLSASSPRVRSLAADGLAVIRDVSSGPALLRLLEDPEQPEFVRDTVALALGLVGYRPAWEALAKHLRDPAKTVRQCAAKGLMFLAEPRATPALETALEEEEIPSVQEQIKKALAAIRAKGLPSPEGN